MAFSMNPANLLDVVALLLRRKKEKKEKVVEYVESIAQEAASLAGVWQKLFDDLARGASVTPEMSPLFATEIRRYKEPNAPYYTRLVGFYNWMSVALGDKLDSYSRENLISHLANLLQARNLTLQLYRETTEEYEKYSGPIFFLESNNKQIDVKDLAQAVAALHKEAAALHVLAKTLHASG